MSIDNQIEPPQSFMALYTTPGRDRPDKPQALVLARYELCEDMATVLTEQAQTIAIKEGLSEDEVLKRCHQGLLAGETDFSQREAAWVVLRLAELLDWEGPQALIDLLLGQ